MAEYCEEDYRQTFPQPELDTALTRGRFEGKVAIVTGGSSGIGRATVERLSNDGASVAIFARSVERGEIVAEELRKSDKNVKFYQVDVTDKERCVKAVEQVATDNGGAVHFLINCHGTFNNSSSKSVGIQSSDNIVDVSPENLKAILFGNIVGSANMVQACYPFMKNDGKNCSIVNITSIRARNPVRHCAPYSTSKAGLLMLSKCMALDLSSVGIRVNSVSPGYVWTPRIQTIFAGDHDSATKHAQTTHMSRGLIEASGIASVVAFLCSRDAMYIDGADIAVDCGNTAMGPEGLGQ